MAIYKDDSFVTPTGEHAFEVHARSGIADDDGNYRFTFWVTAPTYDDAVVQAGEWAEEAHEGIVVDEVVQTGP